jgi:hypothetical protein
MYAIEKDVNKLISDIENDVNVKVPTKLKDPDDLVVEARQALSIRNKTTERSLRNEGVLTNTGRLSIRVAPKNVNRALLIFDTLIKVFKARGHKFNGTNVDVDGQVYEISIREKLKPIDKDYKKLPTGILCLKVYGGYPLFEIYDSNLF